MTRPLAFPDHLAIQAGCRIICALAIIAVMVASLFALTGCGAFRLAGPF